MQDYHEKNFVNVLRRMLRGEISIDTELFKEILESTDLPDDKVNGILLRYINKTEEILRELLNKEPENLLIAIRLNYILEIEGKHQEAEKIFKQCVELCHDEKHKALLYFAHALILKEIGMFDYAKTEIMKAIEFDKLNTEYLLWYANLLGELGEKRKARKIYLKVMHMLPSGDTLKSEIKEALESDDMESLFTSIPTIGAIERYVRAHTDELIHMLSEISIIEKPKKLLESHYENKYLEEAKKSGNYIEALFKIDKDKNSVIDEDPEEWALNRSIDILDAWRPGFELYLNQLFFQDRCSKCKYPLRYVYDCEHGFANCPLDVEYEEYVYETVQNIIKKLKAGIDPSQIPELQIPETLKNFEERFRRPSHKTLPSIHR
ncbi:MAG: tetratricopeptide repeat protein [Thermoprotei archaeon]